MLPWVTALKVFSNSLITNESCNFMIFWSIFKSLDQNQGHYSASVNNIAKCSPYGSLKKDSLPDSPFWCLIK